MITQCVPQISREEARKIADCEFPSGYRPSRDAGDCWFDARWARLAINFFPRYLVHTKGSKAGQPLVLEPWQSNIIGTLFGWKRPDGLRRYRTAYIEVPRKNGKSTIASGIALLLLYLDDEPGAEIYSTAAEREQAAIVFGIAKENVLRNATLDARSKPYIRSITHVDPVTGAACGSYKVLSADAHTKHGYNPHGHIADELHAHPKPDLWEVMQTGMGARSQPMTVAITTAGHDKTTVCYQQHDYAEKVIAGLVDDWSFLPVLYRATADDDWRDRETWWKANPNLGVSVSEEFLEGECKKAIANPAFENTFKRLYLNIWTEQATRAIAMHEWDACESSQGKSPNAWRQTLIRHLSGQVCYGGLDLASKTDIAAFVLLFPRDDGSYRVIPWFWSTEEAASRRSKDPANAGLYQQWSNAGLLTLVPGSRIEQSFIRGQINQSASDFQIKDIGYDPWNASELRIQLEDDGLEMVEFQQSIRNFNEPTKELLSLITEHKLLHGGNPVLRWMASNLSVREDSSGNLRPDKKESGDKIDGIVATIMALGRAMLDDTHESVYASGSRKGFVTLG